MRVIPKRCDSPKPQGLEVDVVQLNFCNKFMWQSVWTMYQKQRGSFMITIYPFFLFRVVLKMLSNYQKRSEVGLENLSTIVQRQPNEGLCKINKKPTQNYRTSPIYQFLEISSLKYNIIFNIVSQFMDEEHHSWMKKMCTNNNFFWIFGCVKSLTK